MNINGKLSGWYRSNIGMNSILWPRYLFCRLGNQTTCKQNKTKKQARGNSPACSSSVPTHHAHFKHLVKCCLKFRFFMGFVTQPCNLHAFYVWKNPGRVSHTPWRAKKLPVQEPYKVLQKTVILVIIINYNSIETFNSRSREEQSSTLLWLVKKHFQTKNKVLYAGKLQRVRFPHNPIHLGGLI